MIEVVVWLSVILNVGLTLLFQLCKHLIKYIDDGVVLNILDWDGKDVVCVVIVGNVIILMTIERQCWESTSCISVQSSILFVCQGSIAENVVDFMCLTDWFFF